MMKPLRFLAIGWLVGICLLLAPTARLSAEPALPVAPPAPPPADLSGVVPAEEMETEEPDDPAAEAAPAVGGDEEADAKAGGDGKIEWMTNLEKARQRALADGKPLLVRAGAPWCPWCEKLAKEMATPAVQEQLKQWTLVYVNIDDAPAEAKQLSIGPIPALRVLNGAGKVVAWEDGYLEADEVVAWLKEGYDTAVPNRPAVLTTEKELEAKDVDKLVKLLATSDPIAREAALRRLLTHRQLSVGRVVEAFAQGKLALRLPTLELLTLWHAPVEGLDPWRPETVTAERIKALETWTEQAAAEPDAPPELSAEALREAGEVIARIVDGDDAEAEAGIERLARFGAALRPLAAEKLHAAASDRARQRLQGLVYRLAASDALVLGWPGGLARLASPDVNVRHQAVSQLVERATAADEALLLELFADPDALVREISLRGLQSIGASASSTALVKLLKDPEPNVRAAVLKQLAESPSPDVLEPVAEYLEHETDPDLVVHGIRVLKAAKAPARLIKLLEHASWQVRAEAAEALGGMVSESPQERQADIYAALIELLADKDPFVVSRAINGLKSTNLTAAVEPLAKAAIDHPELVSQVVEVFSEGQLAIHGERILRGYLDYKEPAVRAQAISALAKMHSADAGEFIQQGLQDSASEVRVATAKTLVELCDRLCPDHSSRVVHFDLGAAEAIEVGGNGVIEIEEAPSVVETLGSFFFGGTFKRKKTTRVIVKQQGDAVVDEVIEEVVKEESKPAGAEVKSEEESPTKEDAEKMEVEAEQEESADGAPAAPAPVVEVEGEVAVEAVEAEESPRDNSQLVEFLSGKTRPKWMDDAVAPLEAMLSAEAPDERMAAALALFPLGKQEVALPVLRDIVESKPKELAEAAGALAWMLTAERQKFFEELLARHPDDAQLQHIAMQMIVRDRQQNLPLLWKLLKGDDQPAGSAWEIGQAIVSAYRSVNNDRGRDRLVDDDRKELTRYASEGTPWQKTIALVRLAQDSAENAGELAKRVYEDAAAKPEFRRDALQLLLLSSTADEGSKLALEALASPEARIRALALLYLADGDSSIRILHHFYISGHGIFVTRSNEAITVEPPAGLTLEQVKPFLADEDEEVAASASYLAALFEDRSGMPKLEKMWRANKTSDSWAKMLYRAISALDDDAYAPLLVEINRGLSQWEKSEFYWTIRSMHGPAVLKLRKQIRGEVGMEQLR